MILPAMTPSGLIIPLALLGHASPFAVRYKSLLAQGIVDPVLFSRRI
jgi:hypothetical protein